jgi:hypothetical protein
MVRLRKSPSTALLGGESEHVQARLHVPGRYFPSANSM